MTVIEWDTSAFNILFIVIMIEIFHCKVIIIIIVIIIKKTTYGLNDQCNDPLHLHWTVEEENLGIFN